VQDRYPGASSRGNIKEKERRDIRYANNRNLKSKRTSQGGENIKTEKRELAATGGINEMTKQVRDIAQTQIRDTSETRR
jgi:hypothetical protein